MMQDPKYKRYADRLRELIEEGQVVVKLPRPSGSVAGKWIQEEDSVTLHAWLTKVHNIIETVFTTQSPHHQHLEELTKGSVLRSYEIYPIIGLLTGALDDLEKGYLLGQEFLIAAEVFDSVLEQSRHLNRSSHKDPAAVLTRVVLEDALRRLAAEEGLDSSQKASQLNDELRKAGKYPQSQWRLIQAWLDIGNAAAHGRFDEYGQEDVERLIEDLERFLATKFH